MKAAMIAGSLIVGMTAAGCGTMVKPGEMGIKSTPLNEEGLESEPRSEGFYFQWLWNDMVKYDVTWKTSEEKLEVLTADDLHVPVSATVTFRPVAEKLRELHTRIGPDYYSKVIRPNFMTLLRTEFANNKHNDLARKSPAIEEKVFALLKGALEGKPFEISRVAITHIEFDRGVTQAISQKLVKQQLSEQKKFELEIAERDAEIARTRAKGESDVIRIHSEGEAQAILTRAKAQAQAQDAVSKTLTPAYLQYKAFDNPSTRYYFVPLGKDGLPLLLNAGDSSRPDPR